MTFQVAVDCNTGIFVTLNPAGQGYAGRQKLPDNLKQLFRPVVMSRPDDTLIAEVILHCEGFKHARVIGTKLVILFDMARFVQTLNIKYLLHNKTDIISELFYQYCFMHLIFNMSIISLFCANWLYYILVKLLFWLFNYDRKSLAIMAI